MDDEGQLFAAGEALVFLPDALLDRRMPITLVVDPAGLDPDPAAADSDPSSAPEPALIGLSTLNAAEAPDRTIMGRPRELGRAGIIAGRVESSRFESHAGRDRVATFGAPRYDPRWVAAELAGIRSAADRYFGVATSTPFTTLVSATSRTPGAPTFQAQLRGRGLVILADQSAAWDREARMGATTALVQRWLGGRMRIKPSADLPFDPGWALWFHGGISRFIAREVLFELGILDTADYISELNAIELELATSPVRDLDLAALLELLEHGRPAEVGAARAQLIARGVIYATALEARYSAHPDNLTFSGAIQVLVMQAVSEDVHDLPLEAWLEIVDMDLLPLGGGVPIGTGGRVDPMAEIEAIVDLGQRPELGRGVLGPCFRSSRSSLRRFELGFVLAADPSTADPNPGPTRGLVTALDPSGPAAKAGLHEGDRVTDIALDWGDAGTPVTLDFERDGAADSTRYLPAGPKLTGVRWRRVAGVLREACR